MRVKFSLSLLLAAVLVAGIAMLGIRELIRPTPATIKPAIVRFARPRVRLTGRLIPGDEYQALVRSRVALIRTANTIAPLLAHPQVARAIPNASKDPVQWISDRTFIERIDESDLYQIAVGHPDAASAAAITNRLVESYVEQLEKFELQSLGRELTSLQSEISKLAIRLKHQVSQLAELQQRIDRTDSTAQADDASVERELAVELAELEVQRLKGRLVELRDRYDNLPNESRVTIEVIQIAM